MSISLLLQFVAPRLPDGWLFHLPGNRHLFLALRITRPDGFVYVHLVSVLRVSICACYPVPTVSTSRCIASFNILYLINFFKTLYAENKLALQETKMHASRVYKIYAYNSAKDLTEGFGTKEFCMLNKMKTIEKGFY